MTRKPLKLSSKMKTIGFNEAPSVRYPEVGIYTQQLQHHRGVKDEWISVPDIVGTVSAYLRAAGATQDELNEYSTQARRGDVEEALRVSREWVNIV